jgi:hypothetical protein
VEKHFKVSQETTNHHHHYQHENLWTGKLREHSESGKRNLIKLYVFLHLLKGGETRRWEVGKFAVIFFNSPHSWLITLSISFFYLMEKFSISLLLLIFKGNFNEISTSTQRE